MPLARFAGRADVHAEGGLAVGTGLEEAARRVIERVMMGPASGPWTTNFEKPEPVKAESESVVVGVVLGTTKGEPKPSEMDLPGGRLRATGSKLPTTAGAILTQSDVIKSSRWKRRL